MSEYRHQAHLDADLETVWRLVATPTRFPEWWPRVIEVDGERFEEGDEYAQVTKDPTRKQVRTNFLIEKRDEMREIRMKCDLTGAYADWVLTPAQGGTFVELEMGMQANRLSDRLMDMAIGRSYFRRWSRASLEALAEAAARLPRPPRG